MAIPSQAQPRFCFIEISVNQNWSWEGVETIPKGSTPNKIWGKRLDSAKAEYDIVRPQRKHWDKRKEMVVGSNPTAGALIEIERTFARFLFY